MKRCWTLTALACTYAIRTSQPIRSTGLSYKNEELSDYEIEKGFRYSPLGWKVSEGQEDEFPVHISAISHSESTAGRQTCVEGAS